MKHFAIFSLLHKKLKSSQNISDEFFLAFYTQKQRNLSHKISHNNYHYLVHKFFFAILPKQIY